MNAIYILFLCSDETFDSGGKSCRRQLLKRERTHQQKQRNANSQKKYYAKKKESDPK